MLKSEDSQTIIGKYSQQVGNLRASLIQELVAVHQAEIDKLKGMINAEGSSQPQVNENGNGNGRRTNQYRKISKVSSPVVRRRPSVTGTKVPDERGWLGEQCLEFINSAQNKFGGGEIARWLRGRGFRLIPYQYNQIFTILRQLADKPSSERMIKRVAGDPGQYEKIEHHARPRKSKSKGKKGKGSRSSA